ncbi:MAG: YeeE/YedE family protein [Deltaproteobacteria bacterium]|nr:YeeE/YedE family protein [Deltaproteobacteria bacterium]
MFETWMFALLGGVLIGGASSLLLLTHGRIAGVSGIIASALSADRSGRAWRLAFLGGLALTGLVASVVAPRAVGSPGASMSLVAIAGLLVGYGTRTGGGCTSGHGVCGLSRLSSRSIVAVATFMSTGALTVWLMRSA